MHANDTGVLANA